MAIEAIGKAVDGTRNYLHQIARKERPNQGSWEISNLWCEAAICMEKDDPDLADKCYTKARYWDEPESEEWTRELLEERGIQIDALNKELLQYRNRLKKSS